jgi:hypothetical protein
MRIPPNQVLAKNVKPDRLYPNELFSWCQIGKKYSENQAYSLTIHKAFCILGNIFATS